MSEYADITVGRLSLFSFRNYVSPDIVGMLFNGDALEITPEYSDGEDGEDEERYTRYLYKTTVLQARERLDAQGYTLAAFEELFEAQKHRAIDYFPYLSRLHIDFDEYDETAAERTDKHITFRKWKNAMKKIVAYELANGNIAYSGGSPRDAGISTECDKVIYYSLSNLNSESYYALDPGVIDLTYVLRLILEFCGDDAELLLDFTYLQYWSEESIESAVSAADQIQKTIVLVEGTSDKDILEFALPRLYPHLADLFYFMDFDDENGKRDGGTSYVVKNLKTFYFSKIKQNFIAVFDNDAEGYGSKCVLLDEIRSWPSNFRILTYPSVPLLKSYPTVAPNGTVMPDDINKKAASIELYLPDILIKRDGSYLPIEWESRKRIKSNGAQEALYQGVISQKDSIKQEFHRLKNDIISGKAPFIPEDWSRMKSLLESIVFAFRDKREDVPE